MYWLIDAFNNVFRTNMEMKTYFSDKEIVRFSKPKGRINLKNRYLSNKNKSSDRDS